MDGRHRGFTLIEALVSSVILAVGAVVVCGLAQRCAFNTARGVEYEQGYRLIDECLETVVASGVGQLSRQEKVTGDFGGRYPGYAYQVEISESDRAGLYEVLAEVSWRAAGQEYKVKGATLVFAE